MKYNINAIKGYTQKRLDNFLIHYYQEAFAEGYNAAVENMIFALNNTKGVGIKTYDNVIATYYQEAKKIKGFEVEEIK